jgi:hypothetical protein
VCLAFYLTYYPAFYPTDNLTVYLTFDLAFYLTDNLTFDVAFHRTFCLTRSLKYGLEFLRRCSLQLYLTVICHSVWLGQAYRACELARVFGHGGPQRACQLAILFGLTGVENFEGRTAEVEKGSM